MKHSVMFILLHVHICIPQMFIKELGFCFPSSITSNVWYQLKLIYYVKAYSLSAPGEHRGAEPLGYDSSSPSRILKSLELSVLQMCLLFGTCANEPLWTSFPYYSMPVLKWGSARTAS